MNPKIDEMGLSFATLCPAFSETDMMNEVYFSDGSKLLNLDLHKETVSNLLDRFGVNRYIPLLLL